MQDSGPTHLRRRAAWLFGLCFLVLLARTWIMLGHSIPIGPLGDAVVLRENKLNGWLHAGRILGWWTWHFLAAAVLWEWVPALLFAGGLWCWLRSGARLSFWPRIGTFRPAAIAFALLLAITAGISWFCFDGIPHVQDSMAQQFQAEIFASGRISAPLPQHPEFFPSEFMVQHGGRWFNQYPPVHAALLAVGVLLGLPWLVNPLLGAASALLIYLAARQAYGRSLGGAALALACVCPFLWFMSGERMNHATSLFWTAVALALLAPALRREPRRLSVNRLGFAGLALGLGVATRPLCGVAVAVPMLAGLIWPTVAIAGGQWLSAWVGRLRDCRRELLLCGLGMLVGVLPLLAFNAATTGSPLVSGYQLLWGASGWGFGSSQWGPPHTLRRGLEAAFANWDAAGKYLFEWPIPCLVPLAGLAFLRRLTRMDRVLLGMLALLTLAYIPYFFQDLCFGPRFLYAGLPAFLTLTARGLRGLGLLWARRERIHPRAGVSAVARAAALCSLIGLVANGPMLAQWYAGSYWGTSSQLIHLVQGQGIHHAVVFIRDYNRERGYELRSRGVSYRTAQGALETLRERWIDQQIRTADYLPGTDMQRTEWLERELKYAVEHPVFSRRRLHPPWIDYQGFSSSFNWGFCADTPDPPAQDVVYALHFDPVKDQELMADFPGRSAWLWDWDWSREKFRLRPMHLRGIQTASGTRSAPAEKSRPRPHPVERAL